jgi:hypothetical protein
VYNWELCIDGRERKEYNNREDRHILGVQGWYLALNLKQMGSGFIENKIIIFDN